MFGPFLGVVEQFVGETAVLGGGLPPAAGPGDGPQRGDAVFQLDHGLGAGADEDVFPVFQEEGVGRRIHQPQRPVELQGRRPLRRGKLLGKDHLDYLSRPDGLPRTVHHGAEGRLVHVAGKAFLFHDLALNVGGGLQPLFQLGDAAQGVVVGRPGRGEGVHVGADGEFDRMPHVVENDHFVREEHDHFGRVQGRFGFGKLFEAVDGLVAQESHRAAEEGRQSGDGHGLLILEDLAQGGDPFAHGMFPRSVGDEGLALFNGEDPRRTGTDEGVAAEAFAALNGLQQEDVFVACKAAQHGNGGFQVGQFFPENRDQIALGGVLLECLVIHLLSSLSLEWTVKKNALRELFRSAYRLHKKRRIRHRL